MGNHRKHIFWPLIHQNPNCTLCHNNDRNTWSHLLSACENPYLKGLRIARHNKAVHLITQTLQANKNTRFFTLAKARKINNKTPDQTIPDWLLKCTCLQTQCKCHPKLRPYILCIIGAPNQTQTPMTPSPTRTVQLIEFTYYHDKFPEQALMHKNTKYDPLINTIQNNGWKTKPLITITARVRGAIHEHSVDKRTKLKIPETNIKSLMKNLHQNAIRYLTHPILNTRKLDNKQTPVPPPLKKRDNY